MHKTFTVHGPVQLDVRLPSGAVDVDATLADRVEIELLASDEESQRLVDAARVDLRETGGQPEILVDVPPRTGGFALSMLFGRQGVGCRVRCPSGSSLKVRTKSAEITAGPELGSVDVATASGDVELDDVRGDLSAKTASGDVRARTVAGRTSIATASGDLVLDRAGGPFAANTASGDVVVGEALADAKANTASGDVRFACVQAGQVSANSASGDVAIGVRRGSRAHLDCTTVSGDASSELELSGDEPDGEGPFVEIRARTVSGDIRITRAQEVHA
jgi:DUF4097 and DUF4098 domain-containing protein YvlB